MHILEICPEPPGGRTLARFDVQLNDDVRLYGLRLVKMSNGRRLSYAAEARGQRTATFAPELADTITKAASAAYEAEIASDNIPR